MTIDLTSEEARLIEEVLAKYRDRDELSSAEEARLRPLQDELGGKAPSLGRQQARSALRVMREMGNDPLTDSIAALHLERKLKAAA